MELKSIRTGIPVFIRKYKYVIFILMVGIVFMLLPSHSSKQTQQPTVITEETTQSLEERLEEILGQIRGAGKVRVLLTTQTGEQILYQQDRDTTKSSENESMHATTVVISDNQRQETGLVVQVISPSYRGAIVLCQGADDPVVKLAILDAVSDITGLRSDRISVLKMK